MTQTTRSHDIDVLLAAARDGGDVSIPEGWGQGRAVYGGVVGGVLVARVLGELGMPEETLRSVTINFVAPALAGPACLSVEVLRRGKSATQVEARLLQRDASARGGDTTGETDESVRAIALFTFGAPRDSSVSLTPSPSVDSKPPFDGLEGIPHLPGVTPDFIARVDLRPATGNYPFSGASSGDLTGYMRFRDVTAEYDLAHLVSLIDAWPPAAGQMLSGPAPMSTMTWTLEFTGPVSDDPATTWWYEVETDAAHDGYAHSGARIFDPATGRLVAISRQTVALFG